jgi:hypothetical protein
MPQSVAAALERVFLLWSAGFTLDVARGPPKKVERMTWLRASCLALLLWMVPGRAQAQDLGGARSLLSDVERIVAAQEVEDWFSDQEALRSIEAHVLASVCRATPEARAWALAGLEKRHAELGDAKALFQVDQRLSDRVEAALTVERQLLVLRRTLARSQECPFWIRPQPGFAGLQSDRKRVTISIESGGNVQFRRTLSHWTFGGGGLGRLLFGYGFDGRYSVLFGAEFGGGAMLRPNTNASQFVINYFPALPVLLRTRFLTWHYDIEVAPVALFQADNTQLSFGGRIGGTFAFTALRRRNVLPWAGLAVAYEYYAEGGDRAPQHFFRGGLRFGLPWEP